MKARESDQLGSGGVRRSAFAVRSVSTSDVPAVVALVRDVLAEYGLRFGVGSETDVELEGLPGSYADRGGAFWVAFDENGGLAGTCGLFPEEPGTFELRKMYLRPEVRGRGLGQILLDTSVAWARSRGAVLMVLDTVEQMGRAIAFYEANGFVRDDTRIRGARCTRGYVKSL
jgi:putative acetyltransferase